MLFVRKHRIILIGDSNFKVYVCNIKTVLNNKYELCSVIKPGSSTSELVSYPMMI